MGQNVHILIYSERPSMNQGINISGGPLSYKYLVSFAILKYGGYEISGSEHALGNHYFPGEVFILH